MSISRFVSDFLHRLTSTPAYSRYADCTPSVIRRCQLFHRAGRDMGLAIPGMSPVEATVIAVESQEADLLAKTSPEGLLQTPLDRCSDWALAVVAEILFTSLEKMEEEGVQRKSMLAKMDERALAALEQALVSPRASPLLDYSGIFVDVARRLMYRRNHRALDLFRQGLAHELRYNQGIDAAFFLRELAEAHLWLDEIEAGLRLFAGLVHNDPTEIWVYHTMAHSLGSAGLPDLALAATRRGLEAIAAYGDDEGIEGQFEDRLDELTEVVGKRRRPMAVGGRAEVEAALQIGFNDGWQHSNLQLCRQLIPDFDAIPVKEPPALPGEGGMAVRPVPISRRRTKSKGKTSR